jgi:hypothetical protein
MPLKTIILAIWAAVHPAAPRLADASKIADAITTVVSQETELPVFGTAEDDAAVMAYYALRESWLRNGLIGDGGRSFGVWQEPPATGRADLLTQARAWFRLLREGARICPDSPAAPLSGGCVAARKVADRRVRRARELLGIAMRTLVPVPTELQPASSP